MIALAKIVSIAVIAVRTTQRMVVVAGVVGLAISVTNAGINKLFKNNEPIWSSRLSPEDNEKHANSLKEKWKDSEAAKSHFIHLLDKAHPTNTAGVEA